MKRLFPKTILDRFLSYSGDERVRFMDAIAECEDATEVILGDIYGRERSGEISKAERQLLTLSLVVACQQYALALGLNREAIERLSGALRTQQARKAKEPASKQTDEIVQRYALRCRMKNPRRWESAQGTASDIKDEVNAALKKQGLRTLNIDAIRKRIPKPRQPTKRTTE
jgi:hypothetical protein